MSGDDRPPMLMIYPDNNRYNVGGKSAMGTFCQREIVWYQMVTLMQYWQVPQAGERKSSLLSLINYFVVFDANERNELISDPKFLFQIK